MESSFGNFHFEIKHATFSAFGIITDQGEWKMLSCSPDSGWPQQPTRRQGTWAKGQVARCYAMGTGSDAPSSNNQTSIEVFRLTDLDFSALSLLNTQQGFWLKQFFIRAAWADQMHIQKGIIPTPGGPKKLGMPTHGSWNAVISGPLIRAVDIELSEMRKEIHEMAIQMGLDIASMVDPTGLCSIPAAGYAMHRGDYLGDRAERNAERDPRDGDPDGPGYRFDGGPNRPVLDSRGGVRHAPRRLSGLLHQPAGGDSAVRQTGAGGEVCREVPAAGVSGPKNHLLREVAGNLGGCHAARAASDRDVEGGGPGHHQGEHGCGGGQGRLGCQQPAEKRRLDPEDHQPGKPGLPRRKK